jgi:hypothetical protein
VPPVRLASRPMARPGLFSGLARPIIYCAVPLLGRAKIIRLRAGPFSPAQMYSYKQRSTNLEIPLDMATSRRPRGQARAWAWRPSSFASFRPKETNERPPERAFSLNRVRLLLHRTHRQAPNAPPPAARGCPAISPPATAPPPVPPSKSPYLSRLARIPGRLRA